MRGALRIGRLFGIDVGVDWTWGIVFVLMSWNLTQVFQAAHRTWTFGPTLLLAVTGVGLLFASLLAHELAHALVARRFGMSVREIRLFMFGGVSNIEREPSSPRGEFWMALVGPLTSFGLGILFIGIAGLLTPAMNAIGTDPFAGLDPMSTLLFWLGPINLIIGGFNLIPGFPLDGGRILRAVVWKATGDLHRATLIATTAGRVFGFGLIALGIAIVFGARVPFFGQGAGSGVWLALIGWFLSSAATRSFGTIVIQEAFEGVTVQKLMRRDGPAVPGDTTVAKLATGFMHSHEHAVPIIDEGRFVGLVSIADIRRVPQTAWNETVASQIMTPRERLRVVAPGDDVFDAVRELGELDVDQLPVVEGDALVGMVSRTDVARWVELRIGREPVTRTAMSSI